MVVQIKERYYSPEDYLELESAAETKSEYRDGKIVPMTGGSTNHNRLAGNFYAHLNFALRGQDYQVFIGDVRLWIPDYCLYTYPDVMLISGKPIFHKSRNDTVTNPSIIVEVLSKSTRDYDKGGKFDAYRSIPEFKEYIIIDQYTVNIEHFVKTSEGKWLLTEYKMMDTILELSAIEFQIQISDIYQGITFADE